MNITELYKIYEAGKQRRYALLFAVNGGAFAIAEFIQSSSHIKIIIISILMIVFTCLMTVDIYAFGWSLCKRIRKLNSINTQSNSENLEVFGTIGQIVLLGMFCLLVTGWALVCMDHAH